MRGPLRQELKRCGTVGGVAHNADTRGPPKRRRLSGKQPQPAWWSGTGGHLPAPLPSASDPLVEQQANVGALVSLDQPGNALISLAAAASLQSAVEEATTCVPPSSNVLGSPVAIRETALRHSPRKLRAAPSTNCGSELPEEVSLVRQDAMAELRLPATSSPCAALSAVASAGLVGTSPDFQAEPEPILLGSDGSEVAAVGTCAVESSAVSVWQEARRCTQTFGPELNKVGSFEPVTTKLACSGTNSIEANNIGVVAVELPIQQRSGSYSPSSGTNSDSDDDTSSSSSDDRPAAPQAATTTTCQTDAGGCTEAVTRKQTASPTSPSSSSTGDGDSSSSGDRPLAHVARARVASPAAREKRTGPPAAVMVASPAWARRRSGAREPAEVEAAKRLSEVLSARLLDSSDGAEQHRLELVASQIARELWVQLRNPRPQLRSILWNLRDPQNPDFAQRVASGLTTTSELPALASEHMASSTKQAERLLRRERVVQESTLKRRLSGAMDPQALAAFRALASRR